MNQGKAQTGTALTRGHSSCSDTWRPAPLLNPLDMLSFHCVPVPMMCGNLAHAVRPCSLDIFHVVAVLIWGIDGLKAD